MTPRDQAIWAEKIRLALEEAKFAQNILDDVKEHLKDWYYNKTETSDFATLYELKLLMDHTNIRLKEMYTASRNAISAIEDRYPDD